jgi:hypothetical protein
MMYPINSINDLWNFLVQGKEKCAFSTNRGEKKGYDKI